MEYNQDTFREEWSTIRTLAPVGTDSYTEHDNASWFPT